MATRRRVRPKQQDTGWRAEELAIHLQEMAKKEVEGIQYERDGEPPFTVTEIEPARRVDLRKTTFFMHTDDGRQYRATVDHCEDCKCHQTKVYEWRERAVE